MKQWIVLLAVLLLVLTPAAAQDDTGDFTSFVNYFFAACESQAVFDLDGQMEAGFDLYIQVFDQIGGQGDPLTPLVRVPVSGTYQVSQVLPYNSGSILALGQFASARIRIASESDPDNELFSNTIDDVFDNCIEPSYGTTDGLDVTDGASAGTPLIDPVTGEVIEGAADTVVSSSGVFTPDGGVLNEVFANPAEAVVQIGARPSENDALEGRVSDVGLIFAECDAVPGADPGRLFDTDNLTVFWSWFAATPELVREHIATAQYEVFLSSPYAQRQVFPNVVRTPIVEREDGNYWVFYTADLGSGFRPGDYRVDYYVTWSRAISDGFEEFGPGTANPSLQNTCNFSVEINPFGIETDLQNPTIPLQQGS